MGSCITSEKGEGQRNYALGGSERTLAIIKPDGVSRNLTGEVMKTIEGAGLKIMAIKMIKMTKEQAKGFYRVHEGKPFYVSGPHDTPPQIKSILNTLEKKCGPGRYDYILSENY